MRMKISKEKVHKQVHSTLVEDIAKFRRYKLKNWLEREKRQTEVEGGALDA
jgi:hypothetical protein